MEVPPSTLRFLQYYTIILQRIRIIAVDAGFEPGTSVPEVWRATNEPPHLHFCKHESLLWPLAAWIRVKYHGGGV